MKSARSASFHSAPIFLIFFDAYEVTVNSGEVCRDEAIREKEEGGGSKTTRLVLSLSL